MKKFCNMKAKGILILIGALGTVIKGLEGLEIRGRVETIQTTAFYIKNTYKFKQ